MKISLTDFCEQFWGLAETILPGETSVRTDSSTTNNVVSVTSLESPSWTRTVKR